ncbi:MAG: glutaredoxin family protein [Bacillota bacterium]|nr:glutaredoxin family protein [Bacillota bacterium]
MKNITIFTSNTCHFCHEAMKWMDEKGIKYTERNINEDKDARQELIKNGFMGVPVLYIGDDVVQGFDKAKIESLLS